MKTSGMGWGAGGKERDCFRVYRRRGLEHLMENLVLFGFFCLSPGANNKGGIEMRRDITVSL